jgi:hypothetical protein
MMTVRLISILPLFLLLNTTTAAQSKMKEFYDAKKYAKCISLCDKNIEQSVDVQPSLLYKSMALTTGIKDPDVLTLYSNPMFEALKCIQKMEKYKEKHPEDKFYNTNKTKIQSLITQITGISDALLTDNKKKEYLNLYNKLFETYPDTKLYLYKIAKGYNFNRDELAVYYPDLSEDAYFDCIIEVAENTAKYFTKTAKLELSDALTVMYNNGSGDLQCMSIFLVNLNKKFPTDAGVKEMLAKFAEKYWQIDMLIQVNKHRATGVTCGTAVEAPQSPLYLSNCLSRTAQKYSEVMSEEDHFSHTSPDGKSPWQRAEAEGCSADGENIAQGSSTVTDVMELWLDSPGHCSNIMGSHTYVGVGESDSYWVQMFY